MQKGTGKPQEPNISSVYQLGEQVLFSLFGVNPQDIGSNTPLRLDEPDIMWLVYKGVVDVFAVEVVDGQVNSPRTHLFRVKEGQAIFGLDIAGISGQFILLAVGTQHTSISRIDRARFEETLQNPLLGKHAIKLLDGWVRNLSQALQPDTALRQVVPLEAGREVQLMPDDIARPRREVVWLQLLAGKIKFIGRDDLVAVKEPFYLPVCDKTWVSAVDESKLHILDTSTLLAAGFEWSIVEQFHILVLNGIWAAMTAAATLDKERLRIRQEQDQRRVDAALNRLAYVLTPTDEPITGEDEADALFVACQLVGEAMGVTVNARPDPIDGRQERQTLESIIRTSGLRVRQVILRDEWWHQDNGPLLAFWEDGQQPIALLPQQITHYTLVNPTTGKKQYVTRAVAQNVGRIAYQFYPTLPNKILHIADLVRFGLRGSGRDVLLLILMGIGMGLLNLTVPLAIGRIFDTIVPTGDNPQLSEFTLLLVVVALAVASFQIVQNIALLRLEMRLDTALQTAVWDRLINLPTPFFRNYTAGDLSTRALGISAIRRRVSGSVILSVLISAFSIFNFVILFYFDTNLALLATAIVLFAFLVSMIVGYRKMNFERQLVEVDGFISGMIFQFITGISKFRVAGVESRAFTQWAKHFTEQRRVAFQAGNVSNLLTVFNSTYPVIAIMLIFAAVSASETASTGEFLAFNAAFTQFLVASLTLSNAVISVLEVIPLYERMRPILRNLPEVDENKADPGVLSGEIEISRLSFRYDEDAPLILSDVSFYIRPGEFVAIVGPSGSGKSTLLRLLLGFEKPESGGIFYDGQDIANLDITSLRQQLGVVLQNGQLMTGDIFSNIIGVAPLTINDAWYAAEMAGMKKDIEAMPMGMHTIISEGGSTLSGGQRQRLLIARAIARRPKILYFDEATSALDNQTQRMVSDSLENLDATRIVIAHRLSTIVHADRIIVLEKGRIAQQGTYQDLIKQPGVFQDLARRQLI